MDAPESMPPPGEATPSRASARRERLIETARNLFSENGFHNTGIAQIAKHSGVLVGQIYRDFANKEEIVAAIVAQDLDRFLADDRLCQATSGCDTAAVRDWIARFVSGEGKDAEHSLIVEIMAESSRNPRIAAIFQSVQDRVRDRIAAALAVLAPHPALADRRALLAEVILTISVGIFHRRIARDSDVDSTLVVALNTAIERDIDALVAPDSEYHAATRDFAGFCLPKL